MIEEIVLIAIDPHEQFEDGGEVCRQSSFEGLPVSRACRPRSARAVAAAADPAIAGSDVPTRPASGYRSSRELPSAQSQPVVTVTSQRNLVGIFGHLRQGLPGKQIDRPRPRQTPPGRERPAEARTRGCSPPESLHRCRYADKPDTATPAGLRSCSSPRPKAGCCLRTAIISRIRLSSEPGSARWTSTLTCR